MVSQIEDASSGTPYWTANARDAEMHTVSQTFGNGVGQSGTYDANTGLLTNLRATKTANGDVASFDFQYDTLGNLNYRHDDVGAGVSEFACYDNLNRLSQYAAGTGSTVTACTSATNNKVVTYDALGNITAKTGVGAYGYNASGSSLPHAVAGIVGNVNGVINPAYSYDANGNMITGGGRTVTYTAFNMAASISQGTTTVSLTYDSQHRRIQMTAPSGTTTYLNDPVSGAMEEKLVAGSTATWHDYIQADGHIVAEKFSGATTAVRYIVADHLGSTAIITDETGAVVERDAYDAWGKRRNLDGSDDTTCSLTSQTTRGFTGHEHIDSECLINANARVYDPTIARFMSADSMVPNPFNGQAFNRYSYVGNNPLSMIDPTGHDSLSLDTVCKLYHPIIPCEKIYSGAGIECGQLCNQPVYTYDPATMAFFNKGTAQELYWNSQLSCTYGNNTCPNMAISGTSITAVSEGPTTGKEYAGETTSSKYCFNCGNELFANSQVWRAYQDSYFATYKPAPEPGLIDGTGTLLVMAMLGTGSEAEAGGAVANGAFKAIGSTGKVGETALQELGGESQVYFSTNLGGRYVDQLVDGVANESKVGYQSLTAGNELQIMKDVDLIQSGQVNGATWHFFTSPVTGLGGPSAPLASSLEQNGITVVVH